MTDTMTLSADEFPEGWELTHLAAIAELITGNTPSKKDPSNYGDFIPLVKPGELLNNAILSAADGLSKKGAEIACVLPSESVLISCIGNLGKTGINKCPVAFNQQINAAVFSSAVTPKFGFYKMQSSETRNWMYANASATTVTIINKGKFGRLPFSLPPLNEQRRIVEKIEELFTKLDAGVESLRKTQALLRKYRQSVLKAAVTGELSREWREEHAEELEPASELLERILEERREKWTSKKYKEPELKLDSVVDIPSGWTEVTLEMLSWSSGYGTSSKCSYDAGGSPVLRIPNISKGELSLEDMKFASEEARLKSSDSVAPGDLLIIRTNGSKDLIGRAAVIAEDLVDEYYFASYLIRYRLFSEEWLWKWIATIWHSFAIKNWIEKKAATSAGQYNISVGSLNTLTLPIPPKEEAEYISSEVERRLSIVDSLEATVEENLKRSESLRQSILKRAFSGRLVPQDPDDEPASVLLERIREERLTTNQKSKKRRGGKQTQTESPSLFPGSDS